MNQTEGLPRIFIASIEANDLAEMSFACKDIFPECKLVQSSDSAALRVALESDHYDIVIFRRGMDKDLRPGARRRGLPAALLVSGRLHAVEARRSAAALAADCLLVDDDASPRALLGAWLAGFSVAPRPAGGELRYERRYEDLVQALPDIVYELDPRGIITFVNDSVSLLGYTAEELLGKHFSTFLHEDDAEAVDRDRILGDYRGRRTGLALSPKLFNERRGIDRCTSELEVRIRKKRNAGMDLPDLIGEVISYGEISAAGEYEKGGQGLFKGSVGIIRDVTLRRRSEETLRKLYQAVDQLATCVFVVNHAFEIEYVNPAFFLLTGFAPSDIIGKSIFRFFAFPPEKAEGMRKHVQDGFDIREEVLVPKFRSGQFWAEFALSPVRSPAGIVTHAIAIAEDISARKSMEELLKGARRDADNANQAKTRFLASMTHELKNPITGIMTAAKLIELDPEESPKRAETIVSYAQSLQDILGTILDYVRSEGGDPVIQRLNFPLAAFIEGLCAPYRLKAAEKGLDFVAETASSETIETDPDRLGRAIGILIDNAVKFTASGSVRVSADLERMEGNMPHLKVVVRDTGAGIGPGDKDRIFEPFTHVGHMRGVEARGAGVGLALARNLVRVLGGEIRMDSSPGTGSSFTLIVPSGCPSLAFHGEQQSPYVLLLVDDNEVNLEYMRTLIENAGFLVRTAESAAEAFKIMERRYVDAGIFDIQMPGYSGFELAKAIRAYAGKRYSPSMPLFAMTAHGAEELDEEENVFRKVFSKPADMRALLNAVKEALAERETVSTRTFDANFAGRKNERAAAIASMRADAHEAFARLREAMNEAGGRIDVRAEVDMLAEIFQSFGHHGGIDSLKLFLEHYAAEEKAILSGILDRTESMIMRALAAAERGGSI